MPKTRKARMPRKALSPLALKFCQWVDNNLKTSEKSAAGLARHLDLPPAEIFNIRNGRREIRLAQLPRISEYFGVLPPVELLGLADRVATQIPCAGIIEPGVWRKKAPTSPVPGETMAYVADDSFPGLPRGYFWIAGDSANEEVPSGGRVVYVDYWEAREKLTDGDLVVIDRVPTPNAPDMREKLLLRVTVNGKHAHLSAPTKTPELQQQIDITSERPILNLKTKEEIEIVGLAIESYKSLLRK